MLSIEGLRVQYGRLAALKGVSLTVEAGEAVCIVGPNGAGKSTLLQAIAGLLSPAAGTILLDGRPIAGRRPEDIARLGLGLVPEGRHIFATLTVAENLSLGATTRRDRRAIAEDTERILVQFPWMRARLDTPGGRLSGGEQQQLAIARALLARPRLLMIDEPSLGLAPLMVEAVYAILADLKARGLTLLIVEQSALRVAEIATRTHVLRGGRFQDHGADEAAFAQAYFGYAE